MIKNYNLGRIKNNRIREIQFIDPESLNPVLWINQDSYLASNAMFFDGTTNYYKMGDATFITAQNWLHLRNSHSFSVAVWVKTYESRLHTPFGKHYYQNHSALNWGTRVLASNKVRFWTGNTFENDIVDSTHDIEHNKWNLIIGRYDLDTNTIGVSLNGSGFVTTPRTKSITDNDNSLVITYIGGGWQDTSNKYFSGCIAYPSTFRYAISDADALSLWNGGSGRPIEDWVDPYKSGVADCWEVGAIPLLNNFGHNCFNTNENDPGLQAKGPFYSKVVKGDSIGALKNVINNQLFETSGDLCGLKYNQFYPSAQIADRSLTKYTCQSSHIGSSKKYTAVFAHGIVNAISGEIVNLYSESNGNYYTDFRLNDGFPEFEISDGNNTYTLTCNTSAFKKTRVVGAVATSLTQKPGRSPQSQCVLTFDRNHNFYIGEQIRVSNVGNPFNGTNLVVTKITANEITYIVNNPSPTTANLSPENGYVQSLNREEFGPLTYTLLRTTHDADVVPITFVRDNRNIYFYVNGILVDTQVLPSNISMPSTGGSSTIGVVDGRSLSPAGYFKNTYIVNKVLTSDEILGLSAYFSVKISMYEGMGPLGVIAKVDSLPHMNKTWAQNYNCVWDFGDTDAGSTWTNFDAGHRSIAPGFIASYIYPPCTGVVGTYDKYDIKMSVMIPHYTYSGTFLNDGILFHGKVGEVKIYPPERTLYVSKGGNASNNNMGTSPNSPYPTLTKAIRESSNRTQILMGSSGIHNAASNQISSRGEVLISNYDDGGGTGPANLTAVNNSNAFLRLKGDNGTKLRNLRIDSEQAVRIEVYGDVGNHVWQNTEEIQPTGTGATSFINIGAQSNITHYCFENLKTLDDAYYFIIADDSSLASFIDCCFSGSVEQHIYRVHGCRDVYFRGCLIKNTVIGKNSVAFREFGRGFALVQNSHVGNAHTTNSTDISDDKRVSPQNYLFEGNWGGEVVGQSSASTIRYNYVDAIGFKGIDLDDTTRSYRAEPTLVSAYANKDTAQSIVLENNASLFYNPTEVPYSNVVNITEGNNYGAITVPKIHLVGNSNNIVSIVTSGTSYGGVYPHQLMWQKSGDGNGWIDQNQRTHYFTDFNNNGASYRIKINDASGNIAYSDVVDTVLNTSHSSYDFRIPTISGVY